MSSSALAAGIRHLRGVAAAQRRGDESDEQLLNAFTDRRDETAFAVLVRRHGPMVGGVCRRVLGHVQDAEDAFQATFLVLARNAASLRNKAALASFLHGTAYRLALSARRAAARRRKHEARTPPRPADNSSSELLWREVRALLDDEIGRLPENYRNVFILCCLESTSRAEAAQRLGVKEGTVASRLTEARKRLQARLAQRGVELTALLAASVLTFRPASIRAAVLLARTPHPDLPPAVAALAADGSLLLNAGKIKLTAVLLVMASVLTGAGLCACRGLTAQGIAPPSPPPPAAEANSKPTLQPAPTTNSLEVQGRVLGPNGQPKAGAKLSLLGEGDKPQLLGVTRADGRFTLALPKTAKNGYLVAQADGLGLDFLNLPLGEAKRPFEFRLVKDRAIRGQIVSTEGKPIAGVRVAVRNLHLYAGGSLDSFLIAWKKRHFMSGIPSGVKQLWIDPARLGVTTTDARGRFVLPGLGAERLVCLHLSGGGIADDELWIAIRDGFDPKPYNQATIDNIPKGMDNLGTRWLLHGPELSAVVEPEKVLRGAVKDTDTGKGRPGVLVQLTRREGGELLRVTLKVRTDARGHYEIRGAHKAKRYMLEVGADTTAGYLPSQLWAEDAAAAGYQPLTADISVKKGVIITGKMLDGTSRKPVPGFAMAAVLHHNPFEKNYPSDGGSAWFPMQRTNADGVFRVVTIPGPVLLMGGPWDFSKGFMYKTAAADPKYPQYFTKPRGLAAAYYGSGGGISPIQGNYCKVLEIKPDAQVIEQAIILERASAVPVRIQDADGKPLPNVWFAGGSPQDFYPPIQCKEAECRAYQVQSGKPRLMVFFHTARKLTGAITVKGDEKLPVVVKLGKPAALTGRLLDTDGNPLAGVVVHANYHDRAAAEVHQVVHASRQVITDAAGAFAFDDLIPGLKLDLSFQRGMRRFERETKPAEPAMQLKAGASRDLGAIKLKQVPEKSGE